MAPSMSIISLVTMPSVGNVWYGPLQQNKISDAGIKEETQLKWSDTIKVIWSFDFNTSGNKNLISP